MNNKSAKRTKSLWLTEQKPKSLNSDRKGSKGVNNITLYHTVSDFFNTVKNEHVLNHTSNSKLPFTENDSI